ncbi:MAG: histidine--tRNA ligase [Bacteroidetes bacterium GWF2_38_335]|nr:MAG: histidine--tRNA ligase [Bacteroidetes bacterium GWF2_38_335]OFY80114.1 MAG: histidine--tRNA ligase [Bacteroidetes bacterium RIFOXYA12_FULL_38_20]HBS88559.1 histidine--tRNA ligase [Bacteroidales bacterium]
MAQTPSIPKGTRDFSPVEMVRRNYIFDHIKSVFNKYGYLPIETPAMENLSTLLGKYGEEGDKLLFKILNSGDFLAGVNDDELKEKKSAAIQSKISEKGLRYDLTVPFARFVVQHRNDLVFPFKRYQIQPVWRADKPQKGRYREFYQCDVDVIGSPSLLNEVELIKIIDEVFGLLKMNVVIKLNNRKILAGIAETVGAADKMIDITVAIDKLDKIGIDKVVVELKEKGLSDEAIEKLKPILFLKGESAEKLCKLRTILEGSETGIKGISEIKTVYDFINGLNLKTKVELDLTLARGLNYYTGAIFEVKALDAEIGSVCGGGRYDDLTGIFGMPDVSGVGVSFGADRIYDVLLQLNAFPTETLNTTKILFVNFGDKEAAYCLNLLEKIRAAGINAELYPDAAKMKKQMGYADSRKIPFVAMIGENEMNENKISLKNMVTGEQKPVDLTTLLSILQME